MTKANLDPAVAALERALLSWHDLAALGQHSYAQMALAEERLRNDQTPDTLHNRGLALQNVLAAALEQLKPPASIA